MVNNLRIKLFLLLGAMAMAASCAQENEPVLSGPVSLKARIADETRATLSETYGTFAFSSGDAIKVFNGSGVFASTSVNVQETEASFTMAGGFTDTGSGFAAYPAAIVSGITSSGVTFSLPTTYTFEQVGGPDASASQVPCPMVAAYTAGQDLVFKQAGAVVRFRVKNCLAGTLTFTFKSQVTGTVTVAAVPTGANDGILADNLTNSGYSITVTDVPEVTGESYFFVTLPVPVGTDPINVSVWNEGSSANKVRYLSGTQVSLNRAGGYKRGVSLVDVQSSATFGGLSIAGFLYNYNDHDYGILTDPLDVLKHYNERYEHEQYYFCWNDIITVIPNLFNAKGLTISGHKYSVPTGGQSGQWRLIVGTERGASTVNGSSAHYAFITVNGLSTSDGYPASSIRGLLLFPDNAVIAVPNGASLNYLDSQSDSKSSSNTVSLAAFYQLTKQGCMFFPAAGCYESNSDKWWDLDVGGYYWSGTNYDSADAYALSFTDKVNNNKFTIYPIDAVDEKAIAYFPICLVRCD